MKLCVVAGTFNPIHNAHLALGNHIKEVCDYDNILYIPAFNPPHKELDVDLADHRFQMVKLAIASKVGFAISNIEFQNTRFSYTYFTMQELYKRYKVDGKIGFAIGYDAFKDIMDWYEADKLKTLVHFLVFARNEEIDKERLSLLNYKGYKFSLMKMPPMNISSSEIRARLQKGLPVADKVPAPVLEYIRENELYRGE